MPKYDIEVQLMEKDGNAVAILGRVCAAMRKAGVPEKEIDSFTNEAMSGDYNHLLKTCMEYVDVS